MATNQQDASDLEALYQIAFPAPLNTCLTVACQLNIADLLHERGKMSLDELAIATNTIPEYLYRVLRCLCRVQIFQECSLQIFCNSNRSLHLLEQEHGSLKDGIIVHNTGAFLQGIHGLKQTLHDGTCAVQRMFGSNLWELYAKDKESSVRFNKFMTYLSIPQLPLLASSYNFAQHSSIIDIGGGRGCLMNAILEHHPSCKRMAVYDLQHVLVQESAHIEYIAGSFFDSVPSGFDAYLLKWILHDHNDIACMKILANIKNAMPKHGTLLIIDTVVPDSVDSNMAVEIDIVMMTVFGGKERTKKQFETLLANCGFVATNIHLQDTTLSILECKLVNT